VGFLLRPSKADSPHSGIEKRPLGHRSGVQTELSSGRRWGTKKLKDKSPVTLASRSLNIIILELGRYILAILSLKHRDHTAKLSSRSKQGQPNQAFETSPTNLSIYQQSQRASSDLKFHIHPSVPSPSPAHRRVHSVPKSGPREHSSWSYMDSWGLSI